MAEYNRAKKMNSVQKQQIRSDLPPPKEEKEQQKSELEKDSPTGNKLISNKMLAVVGLAGGFGYLGYLSYKAYRVSTNKKTQKVSKSSVTKKSSPEDKPVISELPSVFVMQ